MDQKQKESFSARLTNLMAERGLSLREAAQHCGIASSTLSDWKNGATPTDYESLNKLAKLLGTSLAFLMVGEDDTRPAGPPSISEIFQRSGQIHEGYYFVSIERLTPRSTSDFLTNKKADDDKP